MGALGCRDSSATQTGEIVSSPGKGREVGGPVWLVSLRRHRGPGPLISSLCRPQLVGSVLWLAPLVLPRPLPHFQASEADFFQQKKRSCACVCASVYRTRKPFSRAPGKCPLMPQNPALWTVPGSKPVVGGGGITPMVLVGQDPLPRTDSSGGKGGYLNKREFC